MTLTEFLLARIADDETDAAACAAIFPPPWEVADRGHSATVRADAPLFLTVASLDQEEAPNSEWVGDPLEHIARQDPARSKAEAAFKRAMLEGHEPETHRCAWGDHTISEIDCRVKAALAPIYADHPDYDEAWRP